MFVEEGASVESGFEAGIDTNVFKQYVMPSKFGFDPLLKVCGRADQTLRNDIVFIRTKLR